MAGEFLFTLADVGGVKAALNGVFLRGRREPRFALVGRSNVGKSSLINSLLGGRLARVSGQPGKTRTINFFLWEEAAKIVVDLPGYGFAKASAKERESWARFINAYLESDENLERAVVLLDARHGPTELDTEAIRFLSFSQLPVTFVFTKTDSFKTQKQKAARLKEAGQALEELGYDPKEAIWVSSRTGEGIKVLQAILKQK